MNSIKNLKKLVLVLSSLVIIALHSCKSALSSIDPGQENLNSVDLVSDLVAYYPFSGNANDASGNNLHGTVEGAVLTTDRNGAANSAYLFTPGTDVIVVPHDGLFEISDSLTISAWINLNTMGSYPYGSRIIDKAISGTGTGYMIDVYHKDNKNKESVDYLSTVRFIGREGFTNITTTTIALGTWQHIAVTYLLGTVKFYFNGNLVDTTIESENQLNISKESLQIGNDIYGSGPNLYDPFDGSIDEVRIYHRTLNESEIAKLAK